MRNRAGRCGQRNPEATFSSFSPFLPLRDWHFAELPPGHRWDAALYHPSCLVTSAPPSPAPTLTSPSSCDPGSQEPHPFPKLDLHFLHSLPAGGPQTPGLDSGSVADPLWTPQLPSPRHPPSGRAVSGPSSLLPFPFTNLPEATGFPRMHQPFPSPEPPFFPPASDQISAVTSSWKSLGYEQQMGLAHRYPPMARHRAWHQEGSQWMDE